LRSIEPTFDMNPVLSASVAGLLTAGLVAAAGFEDPRTLEVVRLDCTTGIVRSDMTLFGNGTLRLREGDVGEEEMQLAELAPDVFEGYLRRLQQEALGNNLAPPKQIGGLWTEQCELTVQVPEGPTGSTAFGAFDSLSLPLSRVVAIARELVVLAREETYVAGIPRDYVPERGDVLVDHSGSRYRVHGWTSDSQGVELQGVDQPLTIYVTIEALHKQFLSVEERP